MIDIISRDGRWRMKYSSLEISDGGLLNGDQSRDIWSFLSLLTGEEHSSHSLLRFPCSLAKKRRAM